MDNIKKYINIGLSIILTIGVNIILLAPVLSVISAKFGDWAEQDCLRNPECSEIDLLPLMSFIILTVIVFALFRYLILPIFYYLVEKYTKSEIIKRIISKVKNSLKIQFLILIMLLLLSYFTEGGKSFLSACISKNSLNLSDLLILILKYFRHAFFDYLYGSYIFLFVYWYLEKKIKQYIKNRAK